MNTLFKVAFLPLLLAMTALAGCEIEKTEEGEMPQVDVDPGKLPKYEINKKEDGEMPDVDVSGGKLPEYDVDGPDVDVGTTTREVEVPTVDVDMPDEESEVAEEGEVPREDETANR